MRKKLFVIWPEKSIELTEFLSALKKQHDLVYWVGYDNSETAKFPGTIFHSYRNAMLGIPADGIDLLEFPPPDTGLIEKFYTAESIVMTMLNRVLERASVSERRRLYFRLLRYWSGVLKKYNPDAVIFPLVPHFGYDYVIYELARHLGIKTKLFLDTRVPGRLLPLSDFWQGSELVGRKLKENSGKDFKLQDLHEDVGNYYRSVSEIGDAYILPPHIRFQKKKYSLLYRFFSPKVWESLKDGTFFKKFIRRIWLIFRNKDFSLPKKMLANFFYIFKNNLKKEYRRLEIKPDFSEKFIYVPLQVQPEQSSSPQAGVFADQILMIETLAASIPENWKLYVKEHPIQWLRFGLDFSGDRYSGYYKKISEIKNVRLVPIETDSNSLLIKSQAVATMTGAAGWEAILKGKPALIFGYPWYLDCLEILKVSGAESCRAAVEKIKAGYQVNRQKIINYLKAFDDSAIRAFIAPNAGEGTAVTKKESMENIADFILKELN